MTEVDTASFPELGAKSPEMPKPKSAPKGSTRNNSGRERKRREEPVDDGEPLVAPSVVAEPSQQDQDALDAKLKADIEADQKKMTDLEEEIAKVKEERGSMNEATKGIRDELKAHRQMSEKCAQERDKLVEELRKHSEGTKQLENAVAKLRKDLPPGKNGTDAAVLDAQIAEMNQKLETSSMDLKSEKELMQTIKKRTAQKDQIKAFLAEQAKVAARKEHHEELYKKRQAVGEQLTKLREDEKAISQKLEAMRNGEGTPDGMSPHNKLMELMDQKSKVYEGMKAKRAEVKKSYVAYKVRVAEYREYQKALAAYERKVESREWNKRRVEQAQRNEERKAEQKVRDAERKAAKARQEKRFNAVYKGHQMFVGNLSIHAGEEDVLAHFAKFGEVLDCSVVKDNETKLSRGFGFVTFAERAHAEAAIKECGGQEIKALCPTHGRMSCKFAEKSKLQKEWEAKQKAAEARAAGGDNKEAKEGGGGKKADKEDDGDVQVDDAEADDFFAAFGGGADKVVLPEKKEEKKEGKKEGWQATRTEWVDKKEEGGEEDKEEGEGGEGGDGEGKKKKKKKGGK